MLNPVTADTVCCLGVGILGGGELASDVADVVGLGCDCGLGGAVSTFFSGSGGIAALGTCSIGDVGAVLGAGACS